MKLPDWIRRLLPKSPLPVFRSGPRFHDFNRQRDRAQARRRRKQKAQDTMRRYNQHH